ncbi:MAG: hypothetical protein HUK22_09055, partial [Thermoguttaceae bacterium]|nr:hypothetical protein [Thermoguttaceae bacterium]
LFKNGFDVDYLATVEREIPLTYRDTVPSGFPNGAQLPHETGEGAIAFRIPVGPRPNAGAVCGVVVGLAESADVADAAFSATLNGVASSGVSELNAATIPGATRATVFSFPDSAFRAGDNEFSIETTAGGSQKIVFVAVRIGAARR